MYKNFYYRPYKIKTMGVCLFTGGKSCYSGFCSFGAQDVKTTIVAYACLKVKPSPILETQKGNINGTTANASCDTDENQIPNEKGPGTMRNTKRMQNLLENMII